VRRASIRTTIFALPAIAAASLALRAEAQTAVEWQGSAMAGLGVTSNVANTAVPARDAPKGTPAPEWDGFGSITPAIELVLETPRTTNTLTYAFNYRFYFVHHEANAISNSVAYTLGATVSRNVEFTFGLSGAQTQLSAFDVVGSGQTARPLATPTGNNYLLTGVVNESLSVATSELDNFSEGASFSATDNIPNGGSMSSTSTNTETQTYLASATLNYDHSFERDTLGATIGSDAGIFPVTATGGVLTPAHVDLVHRATLDWHHDFNEDWSSSISGGALVAYEAETLSPTWQPTGTATLNYENRRGSAALEYAHSAQPNVLLGEMTLADAVTLDGSIPLAATGLDITGSSEFLASRPLLAEGGFGQTTYSVLVDAALGYQKDPLPLRFELRYQLNRQFALSDPIPGQPAVPEIRRTNVELDVTYFFPHAPPPGRHGPSLVPLPSPSSNPGDISRRESTRGQLEDSDRKDAHDRREKGDNGEKGDKGGESGAGAGP
jgi:hypothetical protein